MRKIFIILICLLIASPAFAGKKPKKSPLLKNEGLEILKKALK